MAQNNESVVEIGKEQVAIDLTHAVEIYPNQGSVFTVSTAPDANGVVRRIEVRASSPNPAGHWMKFALANTTNEQIERLIVTPHFHLAGSAIVRPDLAKRRIYTITPSEGFSLTRQKNQNADIFNITLNPGDIITFIAELESQRIPQITLWEPNAYKDATNAYTLYQGVIIGIAGLLALFLTVIFIIKRSVMFPATAALAWSVLGYVAVDFTLIEKLITLTTNQQNIWRAAVETMLAASTMIFLYAYLNLSRWSANYSYIIVTCLLGFGIGAGAVVVNPQLAVAVARIAFAASVCIGLYLVLHLAIRSFDKAILLLPSWVLIVIWMIAFALTVSGYINNDIVQHALAGAIVIILLLIAFTVMQHAFAGDAIAPYLISNVERQAIALAGSGANVWEWEVQRNEIYVSRNVTRILGLKDYTLNGEVERWFQHMHPHERDRFQTILNLMVKHQRGRIAQNFRLKSKNGIYRWWRIDARPMVGAQQEVVRCVGTIRDITNQKNKENRLLFDAVHDKLTGLPNKELFLDRIEVALAISSTKGINEKAELTPSLIYIDLDQFSNIRQKLGDSFADLALLTVSRRMAKHIKPYDSLAKIDSDKFAVLVISQRGPENIARIAEDIKKSIENKITINDQECNLTASIGIVSAGTDITPEKMLEDAEIAMYYAKQKGGGKIEPYRSEFRKYQNEEEIIAEQLKTAIQQNQIKIMYQPIIHMKSQKIAGFEAKIQWNHPKLGTIMPEHFMPIAEKKELAVPLRLSIIDRVLKQLGQWDRIIPNNSIFVSTDIDNAQILQQNIIDNIQQIVKQNKTKPAKLKLEINENVIMKNPYNTISMLQKIRNLGIGISIDDFGTGHSPLTQLGKFSFDTVKINHAQINNDVEKIMVLKYIIAMAHELKMQTIAHDVDDKQTIVKLNSMKCQYVQGSVFGEPFAPDVALAVLQKQFSKTNTKTKKINVTHAPSEAIKTPR